MNPLVKLSINEALKALKNKDISCNELLDAHIKQAENTQHLNAYITTTFTNAKKMAEESQKRYMNGTNRGLEGIVISTKDLYATKGVKTTCASKMLSNFVPTYESTVTQNMINAGTISIGKTNMDEFAMGSSNATSYFGKCLNPWRANQEEKFFRTPGGSSGGAASSVASYSAMAALGSDTGGSVRQPSAFCGLVGIKPTYGSCSRYGMVAFSSSLDQAGVFARNSLDAALVLQEMMSYDKKDSTSIINPNKNNLVANSTKDIKNLRIGIPREILELTQGNSEAYNLWMDSIKKLEQQGAKTVEIDLPHSKHAVAVYYIIAPAEASSNLARYDGVRFGHRTALKGLNLDEMYKHSRSEAFGEEVKRRIIIGTFVLASTHMDAYYLQAQKVRRLIVNDFHNAFNHCDAILTPTTPSEAFKLDKNEIDPLEMYLNDIYTIPASLAGLPAGSAPCAINANGLPLGMHIIAPAFEEARILQVTNALQCAADSTFTARDF